MTPEEINKKIGILTRQVNDLLAQLIQPLQQLSAWQGQIELLKSLLPPPEEKKESD
jgi:hypothetical protein